MSSLLLPTCNRQSISLLPNITSNILIFLQNVQSSATYIRLSVHLSDTQHIWQLKICSNILIILQNVQSSATTCDCQSISRLPNITAAILAYHYLWQASLLNSFPDLALKHGAQQRSLRADGEHFFSRKTCRRKFSSIITTASTNFQFGCA